ncbi:MULTISPECIES: DUF5684 domain-containing protein [unclassified Microbacterium]|uniref:DUF5684 domain-containing protein n=1 Tax=unclassified Microbacterium TaxID=2609290 RepID=UPI00214C05E7|nr:MULTISPECIES: DUF5684 domain-containing protein [unclassified Microbacterium]MCR2808610.1 DUF5684 domain-containing protein [Microbacterium sp. zg.B185]WIM18956.1 DUF5684 domain-containing protein [Microbacterium sp. zg-B185]
MHPLSSITSQADVSSLYTTSSLFGLVVYIITVIALWKVFTKAGYAGWLAIIPIVNVFVLVKIAGFSAWMGLLYIIPIVNIVFAVIVALRVGKGFGQGAVFSVFLLWLIPFVGYLILGFGSAQYQRARVTA